MPSYSYCMHRTQGLSSLMHQMLYTYILYSNEYVIVDGLLILYV